MFFLFFFLTLKKFHGKADLQANVICVTIGLAVIVFIHHSVPGLSSMGLGTLSLSLSLHFYLSSPPLHFFLALTIGHYILFENACELQRVVFHLEGLKVWLTHRVLTNLGPGPRLVGDRFWSASTVNLHSSRADHSLVMVHKL